jgi:hypothetical protein
MTKFRTVLLVSTLMLPLGCSLDPTSVDVPPRAQPQSIAEIDYARATLNSIQRQSFAENREFCGYIGVDRFGRFLATKPVRGRTSSCRPRGPRGDFTVLASYHSHGAFSEDFDSEIPSYEDMASDILEGVDGYIATPGGRMWHISAANREARLVCGPRCVTADPDYSDPALEPIRFRYSLGDLEDRSGY